MFQSTRPAGGATSGAPWPLCSTSVSIHAPRGGRDKVVPPIVASHVQFQSTRPAGGATRASADARKAELRVSIHAPRGGRDHPRRHSQMHHSGFNPRAPRGARPRWRRRSERNISFQSTRPAGGATFYQLVAAGMRAVSIHAPRGGRDLGWEVETKTVDWFQSTRPAGGATESDVGDS